ncbi:MAG: class I SAM-dependent methyltransferase [Anaerolineae bacterium]|nr:class I SAM-dependent methyltransferase [Anaerolineae bacterium]
MLHFTRDDLDFLTSARGVVLLADLAHADLSEGGALALIGRLRRDFTTRESSAALELARLRRDAVGKFGAPAAGMFFDRAALEQASHPAARAWRKRLLEGASGTRLLDVCCGVGADALALAEGGAQVLGVDLDPARTAMAALNAAALGLPAHFETADARDLPLEWLRSAEVIFFDPARRSGERRLHHVEAYEPPLSTVLAWKKAWIWVKLSPGVQIDQLGDYLTGTACLDFISAEGELKEAVLHLNDPQAESGRRAVMSIDGALHVLETQPEAPTVLDAPRGWLVEPDPAVIRAGAVAQVAAAHGGALLDAEIAYFTCDLPPAAPYLRAWRIREVLPFGVKRLRSWLRAHNIGSVTVKKRGTAVTPEALIPQLKLDGTASCTIVLTRSRGALVMLLCDDFQGRIP